MSAALTRLHTWAAQQATTDPDEDARPLWCQIRDEVGRYLDESRAPMEGDQPLWEEPRPTDRLCDDHARSLLHWRTLWPWESDEDYATRCETTANQCKECE